MKYLLIILLICASGCQSSNVSSISIGPLKDYALKYNPCLEEEDCSPFFHLPEVPATVEKVLEASKIDNDFIIYNTLIMLKLYRAQLERAHQSYDLRRQPGRSNRPILVAFSKYSGTAVSGEFVSSDISYLWVREQKQLIDNSLIIAEMKRIEKVLSNIEAGVYWK